MGWMLLGSRLQLRLESLGCVFPDYLACGCVDAVRLQPRSLGKLAVCSPL